MKLTDSAIRKAKAPKGKSFAKLSDGKGLYLHVDAGGGKYWRFRYPRPATKKENTISFGTYPEVTLAQARKHREDARALIAEGIDPSEKRKEQKAKREGKHSFEAIAREWLEMKENEWSASTLKKNTWLLDSFVLPELGKLPPDEITPKKLLVELRKVEIRGKRETTHRAKQVASQVFRYAIATGRAERDPGPDLKGALAPAIRKHHAAITDPKQMGALLRAIECFEGSYVTLTALRLAPLVIVRPGELRAAEWQEVDLEKAEWRIPATRMKMRDDHVIPLARQAVEALQQIHLLTGNGRFVFPCNRNRKRPMSANTVNAALRRMGYTKEEMTGHGFRAMASTRLNEMGWRPDVIERQLSHVERNKVRAAYNRAQYLDERRQMLQAWADYLDSLKGGAEVIPIRRA